MKSQKYPVARILWPLKGVCAQSQSLLECLSEHLSSQNTHAEAMGLHLELHGFTVHLICIHLCGTKERAMTGKTGTQLAFSLLSWLMLPLPHHLTTTLLVLPWNAIQQQNQELLHYFTFTSHSGRGTSAFKVFLFLFLPQVRYIYESIHISTIFYWHYAYNSQMLPMLSA